MTGVCPRSKKSICKYGHPRTPDNLSSNNHCLACGRRDAKKYNNRRWARQIRDLYDITPLQYQTMLVRQDFKCAICKRHANTLSKRLDIDHDHKTSKIRGLLCPRCNSQILVVLENYAHLIPVAQSYLRGELYAPVQIVSN